MVGHAVPPQVASVSRKPLSIAFEGLPHGALWMRPGADYLCVEPWCGYADPEDFKYIPGAWNTGMLRIPEGPNAKPTLTRPNNRAAARGGEAEDVVGEVLNRLVYGQLFQ